MLVRILTSVLGLPILIFFVYVGGLPLYIAAALMSVVGMYEFYTAVSGKLKAVHALGFFSEILLASFLYMNLPPMLWCAAYMAVFMGILFILVFDFNGCTVADAANSVFGFLYVGVLLTVIAVVRSYTEGLKYVWLIFIFAFVSDTGAYFTGIKLGRHKLAPVLSPKKSVEGAVGGVLCTSVVTAIYAYVLIERSLYCAAIYFAVGAVGSFFAQIGDLAASSVKRHSGIKDYGSLFPGHGGVLDRFDSVLFTSAFVFICQILHTQL